MNRVGFFIMMCVFSMMFLVSCSDERCEMCNKKITKSNSEKKEVMEAYGIEGNLCNECYEKRFFETVETLSEPAVLNS